MGDEGAPQDRPHRVPVADPAVHRSGCRVPVRARRPGARRGSLRGSAVVRRERGRVHAPRRAVLVRGAHRGVLARRRPGARPPRQDRACGRRGRRPRIRPAGGPGWRRSAWAGSTSRPTTAAFSSVASSSTTRSTRGAAAKSPAGPHPAERGFARVPLPQAPRCGGRAGGGEVWRWGDEHPRWHAARRLSLLTSLRGEVDISDLFYGAPVGGARCCMAVFARMDGGRHPRTRGSRFCPGPARRGCES